MNNRNLNEQLMTAVEEFDLDRVADCLAKGADPSYWRYTDEEETTDIMQPTTPLRMVMFRISDNFLTDSDLRIFEEIARLLVKHGADIGPAMEIAERRYGKYDPGAASSPFMDVWHAVAKGKRYGPPSEASNKLR